tara:strand:- start:13590 stop:14225 length:636 start_codon:yes stop_codon:yes gene_type:complete
MESKNIYKALADFQQEVPVLLKGTDGYGYKYIKLEHIITQINPILKKHNLGFTQCVDGEGNYLGLTTILFHHPSGENIVSSCTIPDCDMKGMNKFQSAGAGITYFRRYALSSMLGIISDADTDAKEYTTSPKKTPFERLDDELGLEKIKITNTQTGKVVTHKLKKGTREFDNAIKHIKDNPSKSLNLLIKDIEKHYIVNAIAKKELSKHVE